MAFPLDVICALRHTQVHALGKMLTTDNPLTSGFYTFIFMLHSIPEVPPSDGRYCLAVIRFD